MTNVRSFRKVFWATDDSEQIRLASVAGVIFSVLLSLTIISVRHPFWCVIAAALGAVIFRAVAIEVFKNHEDPKIPAYDSLVILVVLAILGSAFGVLIAFPSGNPVLWAETLMIASGGVAMASIKYGYLGMAGLFGLAVTVGLVLLFVKSRQPAITLCFSVSAFMSGVTFGVAYGVAMEQRLATERQQKESISSDAQSAS
jgi:hypothetical protein